MSDLFSVALDLPGFPCAFSEDRRYRYALWRHWGETETPRYLMVIGLNPSTADETNDDPTIRRCIGFAKAFGYDALCMTNLFAFRATDPADMKATAEPVGEQNDLWLWRIAKDAGLILAAWGVHGSFARRDERVLGNLAHCDLHALGYTKHSAPRHPLYLPKSAVPVPFPIEAAR